MLHTKLHSLHDYYNALLCSQLSVQSAQFESEIQHEQDTLLRDLKEAEQRRREAEASTVLGRQRLQRLRQRSEANEQRLSQVKKKLMELEEEKTFSYQLNQSLRQDQFGPAEHSPFVSAIVRTKNRRMREALCSEMESVRRHVNELMLQIGAEDHEDQTGNNETKAP
jgi:superfamily II RNA helicase